MASESTKTIDPVVFIAENPSEDERERVAAVEQLWRIARSARRPLLERWRENYRMLFNRGNTRSPRTEARPITEIPEILPIIRAQAGFMLDQRITHTVAPIPIPYMDDNYQQFLAQIADDLETVLGATWHANLEEREWQTAVLDGLIYGTGILKTSWEKDLAGGLGDAVSRRVHPFFFYPDPRASNELDGEFYIHERFMTIQELDRRFPGAEKLLKGGFAGPTASDQPPSYVSFGDVDETLSGVISAPMRTLQDRPGESERPTVQVIECWVREHSYRDNQLHVSWRVVVVAGGRILLDTPAADILPHGLHPFARFAPMDIGEFWGPSMVEILTPSQQAINRLLTALQQNVELTGNPVWKEATNSPTPRTTLINRPGQRIPVGPADQVSGWEAPPPIDSAMIQLLQYHLQRMEVISGFSAIQKGAVPPRTSQGVIDSVQESAFVVIRQAQRNLEYAMRVAGKKKADLIITNYTTPRVVAIAGSRGERSMLALRNRHFYIPSPFGLVPLEYQLMVDAGSRRHTARTQMEERAIQLGALGLLPPSEVLVAIDWPNAREIGRRVEEMMAAGAMAAGQRQRARA